MTPSAAPGFAQSEEQFHAEAAGIAGCDDFGDASYLEGLRVLLRGYDEEARFNEHGAAMARQMVLGILVSRLQSQRQLREQPEILEMPIERPLVICGLIRTGSTALHLSLIHI